MELMISSLDSQLLSLCLSLAGLFLLAYRLLPLIKTSKETDLSTVNSWPFVSIIVPARNEEHVIGNLLHSLESLDYPHYEVIVVDDQSHDNTAEIVKQRGNKTRLITGKERPEGWHGKQWACHQGAQVAQGDLLLFTDADTQHNRLGLKNAVHQLRTNDAALLSCVPFHQNPSMWERLLGPFHMMLLAVTAPAQRPRPGRVYCVGQYLLFTKNYYKEMGGHEAVSQVWIDDIPIANLTLRLGARYHLITHSHIFSVRMYPTLKDFITGWRRNFRAGMGLSAWWAPLEISTYIAALTGAGHALNSLPHLLIAIASSLIIARTQILMGRFSILGVACSVWSMALFTGITGLAVWDMISRRKFRWKGRSYEIPDYQTH